LKPAEVGSRGEIDSDNDTLWLSMAIHKHEEKYKIYLSEIYESKIAME
jgi:hypothetical protein